MGIILEEELHQVSKASLLHSMYLFYSNIYNFKVSCYSFQVAAADLRTAIPHRECTIREQHPNTQPLFNFQNDSITIHSGLTGLYRLILDPPWHWWVNQSDLIYRQPNVSRYVRTTCLQGYSPSKYLPLHFTSIFMSKCIDFESRMVHCWWNADLLSLLSPQLSRCIASTSKLYRASKRTPKGSLTFFPYVYVYFETCCTSLRWWRNPGWPTMCLRLRFNIPTKKLYNASKWFYSSANLFYKPFGLYFEGSMHLLGVFSLLGESGTTLSHRHFIHVAKVSSTFKMLTEQFCTQLSCYQTRFWKLELLLPGLRAVWILRHRNTSTPPKTYALRYVTLQNTIQKNLCSQFYLISLILKAVYLCWMYKATRAKYCTQVPICEILRHRTLSLLQNAIQKTVLINSRHMALILKVPCHLWMSQVFCLLASCTQMFSPLSPHNHRDNVQNDDSNVL